MNSDTRSNASQWGAPSHGTTVQATDLSDFQVITPRPGQFGMEGEKSINEQPPYQKLCNSLEASTTMATKLFNENEVLKNEVMALRAEVVLLRERGHTL